MTRKRHPLSSKAIEANHRNSKRSTGPRTWAGKRRAALNSLKHGRCAQPSARPMWETMTELGESPTRFRSIMQDVLRSYPPRNPLEMMVAEDVAKLYLQRERNQQAQEAKLQRSFERLELDRHKRWREMTNRKSYDALQAEVLETGLRRAPDSPSKFLELLACLERLLGRVEKGNFSEETELRALYGAQPTFRGAGIVNAFRALAKTPAGTRFDQELWTGLRMMILEESRDVEEESSYYTREHVEISRAMRKECLAPNSDREYALLRRQEGALDRQLDRKIRLLIRMHSDGPGKGAVLAMPFGEEALAPIEKAGGEPRPVEEPVSPRGGIPTDRRRSPMDRGRASAIAPYGAWPAHPEPASAPFDTAEAAEVSMRHKVTPLERPPAHEMKLSEETLRRIRQIYGLDDEPSGRPVGATRPSTEGSPGGPGPQAETPSEGESEGDRPSPGDHGKAARDPQNPGPRTKDDP